ncbi:MAG: hypothetical protein P8Z50_07005 [candidate division WOR-3 bacterium]
MHNITFYMDLMSEIRKNIEKGTFYKWRKNFLGKFKGGLDD